MGKFIDLTGTTINEITILCKDEELSKQKGRLYWKCQCSCGRIKSIRSDSLKKIKTCGECNKNLIGQKFGRLLVLEKGKKDKAQHQYYVCKCDCGNICEINSDNLRRGLTKSCGCLHSEIIHKNTFKDITGQKFGKLTAIDYEIKNSKAYWKCRCDCGNETIVANSNLINGHTTSCGCIKSKGELLIRQLLLELNISFKTEYIFKNLPNRRFDFYLIDKNICIEYDGRQHFNYNTNWYKTKEDYLIAQKRDLEKDEYCKKNDIPLIRIPYSDYDKLNKEYLKKLIEEAQEIENV